MPAASGRNLTITIGAGLTGSFSSSFSKAEASITRLNVGVKKLDGTMTGLVAKSEKVALALRTVTAGVNMLSQATTKANASTSGSLSQNAALTRSNERLAASYKQAAIQRRGLTLSSQSRITPPPGATPLRPATPLAPRSAGRGGVNYGAVGHGLVSLGTTSLIAGGLGYEAGKGIVEAASEYQHQLSLANASGMTQLEIAEATQAAWKTTGTVLTTTFSKNLEVAQELRGVFGNTEDAISHLAKVQEVQAVLGNLIGGEAAEGQSYSLARALEARRATIGKPGEFNTQADLMTKAIVAFKGKVTATDFQSTFKFARSAAQGWNNEFTYKILPTLMQEMKSSGGFGSGASGNAGTMLSSAFRNVVIGRIPKQNLKYWEQLGLLDPDKIERNKKGVASGLQPGGVRGSALFISNPFEWVQKYLAPALGKAGANTTQKQLQAINTLVSDRTAAHVLGLFTTSATQFHRDMSIIERVKDATYKTSIATDPKMQYQAAMAQWQNLLTVLGIEVLPSVIVGTSHLISFLRDAQGWIRKMSDEHGPLIRNLELAAGGITALALAFGAVVIPLGLVISGLYNIAKVAKAIGLIRGASSVAGAAGGVPGAVGTGAGGAAAGGALRFLGPVSIVASMLYLSYKHLTTPESTKTRGMIAEGAKHFGESSPLDKTLMTSTPELEKAKSDVKFLSEGLAKARMDALMPDMDHPGSAMMIPEYEKRLAAAQKIISDATTQSRHLNDFANDELRWKINSPLYSGSPSLQMRLNSKDLQDTTTFNPRTSYGFGLQPHGVAKSSPFDTTKESATDAGLQSAIEKAGWKPSVTEKQTNITFGDIKVSVPPEATRETISRLISDQVGAKFDEAKRHDPDSEEAAEERSRLGDSQEE